MHGQLPVRLGNYELLSLLGAGGMGQVYRARDVRLSRSVAIKMLRGDAADIVELRERFEREARAVASLNHPHICTLYDIGCEDSVDYLVMELVEGETLGNLLEKGALSADQAVLYAIQIADALDQAHRRGVVHRDLKPGNIMVTKAGVKMLDFGLAKLQPISTAELTGTDISTRFLSREGTVLGTPQYMSPEQLRGRAADARTDIFALGVVLYEMIAGRRAFEGGCEADVAAAILSSQPPSLMSTQRGVPPPLDHVVKRCLAKDPDERWQTARDAMLELEWIGEAPALPSGPAGAPSRWQRLGWPMAALLAVMLAFLAILYLRRPAPPWLREGRFAVSVPVGASLEDSAPVLSPDGSQLAFIATQDGQRRLWIRRLDSLAVQALPGTEGASGPFWSPQGNAIGFFSGGKLKEINVSGGGPQVLCDAMAGRGGTWNREGVIVFASSVSDGLYRISAAGGEPVPVTTLNPARLENSHRWPKFLPDGRHFLYYIRSGKAETQGIFLGTLNAQSTSADRRPLLNVDSNAEYVPMRNPGGLLLFVRERGLIAQPFDADRLRTTGEPFLIVENVSGLKNDAAACFSASENGVLAFGDFPSPQSKLIRFDRLGRRLTEMLEPGPYMRVRLSPNEKQAAVYTMNPLKGAAEIWLVELSHGLQTRFTTGRTGEMYPVWSPDGRRIAFSSLRDGVYNLYQKASAGTGVEELLVKSNVSKWPVDWSRDGRFILYQVDDPKTHTDIWVLALTGERRPFQLLGTEFVERNARFSPEGRWVAYASNETGQFEIYVLSFPDSSVKRRISINGGDRPVWRGDGMELFYVMPGGELMAAPMKANPGLEVGAAKRILGAVSLEPSSVVTWTNYDVAAEGQQFLAAISVKRTSPAPITIIMNWFPQPPTSLH
jgi:eukaryotic-like serine/threonine-protein kinase